ncbi:MAG: type II secretion system F family protein, partial [Helicobacter sp.]|nr:type II secretion system F family protein [Helicobacter sp.]
VYSQNGVLHTIEFQAESRESAIQYFKQNHQIQLIKITQIAAKRRPLFRKSLSTKELSLVFYQFAILLNAAIPLHSLLESLAQYPHPRIAAMFAHVLSAVQNGQQLRDGFAPFAKELGIGIELIALGEKSGNLPQTLMLFVDFLRAKEQNQKRLLNALAYPLFLCVAIIGALFVIIGFLLPQFESLFMSFNKQLPPLTQFLFSLQILTTPLFLLGYGIGFCVLMLLWVLLRQNETFQQSFDALLLRIPFIGNLLRA